METKEDVIKSCGDVIGSVFSYKDTLRYITYLYLAIQGNQFHEDIVNFVYKLYSTNTILKNSLSDNKIQKEQKKFERDLKKFLLIIKKEKIPALADNKGFYHFQIGPTNISLKPKYRLYCNFKVNKVSLFMKEFNRKVLKKKTMCLCGGRVTCKTTKIICSNKNCPIFIEGAYFKFKTFNPIFKDHQDKLYCLRKDKMVFYLPTKEILDWMITQIRIISESFFGRKFFAKDTPNLTHKIFSGLGYSFEPPQASEKEEKRVSFGEWISKIITKDFILIAKASKNEIYQEIIAIGKELGINENNIEKILNLIKNINFEKLSKNQIRSLENKALNIKKIIVERLEASLSQDPELNIWIEHLREFKKSGVFL